MLEFHTDIPEVLGFIRISKCRIEIKSLTFRRSVMSFSAGSSTPKKGVSRIFYFFHYEYIHEICALLGVYAVRMVFQEEFFVEYLTLNPLNPELNPICYLLTLLGVHHFLHVSKIRDKLLTFRRLMSYIYI